MTRLGNVRDFELLKFLGKGTFGAVYQARRAEDKRIYAIKKVDTRRMSTKERTESVNEIRVLASLSGPHVITFNEAFVDADILYIVTEFATHGDLLGYLKHAKRNGQLPEATVWALFIQMCLGVQSLHDKNILHRDLKAANVFMFSNSYLKLGDFGVSKVLKTTEQLARTQVGTPYYVAPEVWRNKPYNNKCDMWSLGCLLYELCTYRPPFEAGSMEALARTIMRGKYDQIPAMYSKGMRDAVARLLVVEPQRRASVQEVLAMDAVVANRSLIPNAPAAAAEAIVTGVDIVRTIQVPHRFHDLTKALPPSRYDNPLGAAAPPPSAPPPSAPVPRAAKYGFGAPPDALNPVREAPEERIKLPLMPGKAGQHAVQQQLERQPPQQQPQRQRVGAPYNQQQQQPPPPLAQPMASQARYAPPPSLVGGPTREVRMVYHNKHGGSRDSIFRSGESSFAYNPITHQRTGAHNQPGGHANQYQFRQQPGPLQHAMQHPSHHVQNTGHGARPRRMDTGGWY